MARTSKITGTIHKVGEVTSFGTNGAKQDIVIKVPGYVDRYSGERGQDEFYQVSLFNDQIEKRNLYPHHEGSKVEFELNITSREWTSKDGKLMYIMNARFASLEFVQAGYRSPQRPQQPHSDFAPASPGVEYYQEINKTEISSEQKDDLPF